MAFHVSFHERNIEPTDPASPTPLLGHRISGQPAATLEVGAVASYGPAPKDCLIRIQAGDEAGCVEIGALNAANGSASEYWPAGHFDVYEIAEGEYFSVIEPSSVPIIGSLPTLPSLPDAIVTNKTELLSAVDAAPATGVPYAIAVASGTTVLDLGSTNYAGGGFTNQTVTIDVSGKHIILYPQNGFGAFEDDPYGDGNQYAWRFQRTCTIKGWTNIRAIETPGTFEMFGFERTVDAYPDVSTPTVKNGWESAGVVASSPMLYVTGPVTLNVQGNEFYMGKNLAHDPFSPTEKLYDYNSPATWERTEADASVIVAEGDPAGNNQVFVGHGDADFPLFNRMSYLPQGIVLNSWAGASCTVRNNYFHDLGYGSRLNAQGTATNQSIEVSHNEYARQYTDNINIAVGQGAKSPSWRIHHNIIGSCVSNPHDNGNPHTDAIQAFVGYGDFEGVFQRVVHGRFWGNLLYRRTTDRGGMQGHFLSISASHLADSGPDGPVLAVLVGTEIHESLALGQSKIFTADAQEASYITNTLGYTRDSDSVGGPASISYVKANDNVAEDAIADTIFHIENSIYEALAIDSGDYGVETIVTNSTSIGNRGSRTVELSTVLATPTGSEATISDLVTSAVRTAGYVTQGPTATTLAGLMTTAEPNIPRIAFVSVSGADTNAAVESTMQYLHGIVGTSVEVVPGPGLEWRTLDAETLVEIDAYSSSSGTAECGQLIQLRATSAATTASLINKTITIGGNAISWPISTASTAFSLAQFTSAQITSSPATGLAGATDTRKFWLGMDFVPSSTGTPQRIMQGAGGAHFQMIIGAYLDILIRNSGKTVRVYTPAIFTSGNRYKLLVSVDLDAGTTYEDCIKVYCNGSLVSKGPSGSVDTTITTIKLTGESLYCFASSANSSPFLGQLGCFAFKAGETVDWSDAANRLKFSNDLFGDGSVITGNRPEILFHGDAATLNATDAANEGTGGTFDNKGTDVTDV